MDKDDKKEGERAIGGASVPASPGEEEVIRVRASEEGPHAGQPLVGTPPVLSRRTRLAVPAVAIGVLLVLAVLVESARGTTAGAFTPIYIFIVVIYVLSSIYLFKTFIDRDKGTALPAGDHNQQTNRESHR